MNRAIIGPAGSGKTYSLLELAVENCGQLLKSDYQRLLAITFMHGARKNLNRLLRCKSRLRGKYECETIDALCFRVSFKYRKLRGLHCRQEDFLNVTAKHFNLSKGSFDGPRRLFVELMRADSVGKLFGETYPIVLVDEFQDCSEALLDVIKAVALRARVLIAADDFQSLEIQDSKAAMEWLSENFSVTELSGSKRTSASTILDSAYALRDASLCTNSVQVEYVSSAGLAAWQIASTLCFTWKPWQSGSTVVLLSPCGFEGLKKFGGVFNSLRKKLGKKKNIGPFPFVWEESSSQYSELVKLLLKDLGLKSEPDFLTVKTLEQLLYSENAAIKRIAHSELKRSRILGVNSVEFSSVCGRVGQIIKVSNNSTGASRRTAMTIHAAKNREFDYVIILWPYTVKSDSLYKRKLMYNAITRAKKEVLVIVQGEKCKRNRSDAALTILSGTPYNKHSDL